MDVFLDPELADAMGLVGIGGDLSPQRLLQAYRSGIFPWYDDDYPVCWWSPDPRAIFELDGFHVSRRFGRTLRSGRFTYTVNQSFAEVMQGCADRDEGTWITADMLSAYEILHELGWAHSVEVWQDSALAGGLYGVAVGGLFAGESMFHRRPDASKAGLAFTIDRLRERGFSLFDIQMITGHTASLGAVEIPRTDYLARLKTALQCATTFAD
jgi:leucyl/phenylalanyl-tRNA--protein transferase